MEIRPRIIESITDYSVRNVFKQLQICTGKCNLDIEKVNELSATNQSSKIKM